MSNISFSRETTRLLACAFVSFFILLFGVRANLVLHAPSCESNASAGFAGNKYRAFPTLVLQQELEKLQSIEYVKTTICTGNVHKIFPVLSQLVLDNRHLSTNLFERSLSMLDQPESKAIPAENNSALNALHGESLDSLASAAEHRPMIKSSFVPGAMKTSEQAGGRKSSEQSGTGTSNPSEQTDVLKSSSDSAKETKSNADDIQAQDAPGRWTRERSWQWQKNNGWLVGSNFLPANAINQLEMWQKDTFDKQEIDRELGWAESLGMNTMRVFLHDLLWQEDPEGFKKRIDEFLTIADKHHIKPVFVLFDSCWDPDPKLGKQHEPVTGVHNSGWVQSPGKAGLTDANQKQRLETYVKGVVSAFGNDPRVLMWDVWNEPDNMNDAAYKSKEPANKIALVQNLLPQVFQWARSANPTQPLSSGVWIGDWSSFGKLSPIQKAQLENSDVITFHNYGTPQDFEQRTKWLSQYDRPQLCTEYMARPMGSTFDPTLAIAKKNNVGMINWGFVAGKSQTYYPWDSWQKPYPQPYNGQWFHDIFRPDGTPYNAGEVDYIKRLTSATKPQARGWFTQFLSSAPAHI